MRSAADLIQELSSVDESNDIEAKRGSAVDRSIMESVCAFANEPGMGGGYIVLGVVKDPQDLFLTSYLIEGIDDPDKINTDFASQCGNVFNIPIRPKIKCEKVQGKNVIVVFVPESPPTDKPVYIKNLGLPKGAYRRVGSTDHQGSEDDLISLYAGHQIETYDTTIIGDSDMSDLDVDAIDEYRALRHKINPLAEELGWSDEELLRSLACIKKRDGILKATVAGIMLFGTKQALRRCFPMTRIDYIRVAGTKWVQDPDKRFDTLEIREPLIKAIRRASNTVRDELIQSFSLPEGALTREDEPALPFRVIREAIVNAVMHRSYRVQGSIQIIRYANRLEIRNPGHSLKAEDQLGEPGSETRNPAIAAVLHELNIAETKGSGIRTMRKLMQEKNLIPPTLVSTRVPDQFVATFLFHHFLSTEDISWLRNLTSEPLTDEHARAIIFLREVGAIDNSSYRTINSVSAVSASIGLRKLREIGILEAKGNGSKSYYVPSEAFNSADLKSSLEQEVIKKNKEKSKRNQGGHQLDSNSHQLDSNSHQLDSNSHQLDGNSHQLDGNSHQLDSNSHQSTDVEADAYLKKIRDEIPEKIMGTIKAMGGKPRKEVVRKLIIDICNWRPLNAKEIAFVLGGRDNKVLVRSYLTPMVKDGLIAYTIPEMEFHPDQRYTAK